jgi:hypothetical protein
MGSIDTIRGITDNIETVLSRLGVRFARAMRVDPKAVPATLLPSGRVVYAGERFETTHGQRPGYVEARFDVTVLIGGGLGREAADRIRAEQEWAHYIRSALTVSAVNSGALAESRLVSRVDVSEATIENEDEFSTLTSRVTVRYRET